mmetsp:Transcript_14316/g.21434  ORF Transcript_14316/g.21434 Transcript_14316/m.21434 type:complete len:495 (+) Transcript_14316:102-1586(+)
MKLYAALHMVLVMLCMVHIHSRDGNCSTTIFVNDQPSVVQTLAHCLSVIADPILPPSYYKDYNRTVVKADIILNNLHFINEIEGTAQVDFYFRLFWSDPRVSLTTLWDQVNPELSIQGAEISGLIFDNEEFMYKLWTPDIHFVDAQSVDYIGQTLRIYPNGTLQWSRHTILTIVQPYFDYSKYPSDKQIIEIRFESYAFPTVFVEIEFNDIAVMFVKNGDPSTGTDNFKNNPIWKFESFNAFVVESVFSEVRSFSTATVDISVSRQSSGVILRLVCPIVLLTLLAGCTFWACPESRADTTITLLLSVSALYIVVFANIPMLGYLTKMDYFTFFMFFALVAICLVHQTTNMLMQKQDKWPLRVFLFRLAEFIGRVFVIPFVAIYFIEFFPTTYAVRAIVIALVCGFISVVCFTDAMGVVSKYVYSMKMVELKMDRPTEYDISTFEIILFNLVKYKKLSISLSEHSRMRLMKESRIKQARMQVDDGDIAMRPFGST